MLFKGLAQRTQKSLKSLSLLRKQAYFFGVGDTVTVREALNMALFEEMERDSEVKIIILYKGNNRQIKMSLNCKSQIL